MRRRWTRSSSPAYWNHESAVVGNKDCAHKRVEAVKSMVRRCTRGLRHGGEEHAAGGR
jgi:hypothetical protein